MARTTSAYEPANSGTHHAARDAGGWAGWIMFAGSMMLMLGTFHAFAGLVALTSSDYYLVGESGLALQVSYTGWGWAHLIGGIVVALAGIGVFSGSTWARIVGITMAVVSGLLNFAFLAAYPFWSLVMIAVDIFVIYALSVHGRSARMV